MKQLKHYRFLSVIPWLDRGILSHRLYPEITWSSHEMTLLQYDASN
ncbi:hypothetical protein [Rickettsia endosymbiont of Ixodes pacificus]|nr:hypothetical protein [Rickettsia endosymbiont of Ixodes pacificus]